MTAATIIFWLCAACVGYAYAGYPLLLALAARLGGQGQPLRGAGPASVSVIIAAHNEEASIERRLDEFTSFIVAAGVTGEIIVVSDGSTDQTAALARAFQKGNVRVLELPANSGKAVALNAGCAAAAHDILVFADTRQSWDPDALRLLLENFADSKVGAVSGHLVVEGSSGVLAGVGLYWRYEKWLRQQESRLFSTVGVTGAISAVRRPLFQPLPHGLILDDVYWPLRVAMQGFRVVHDNRAQAYDRLPERTRDEFARKIRTLSGNFQLVSRLPAALLPWRNPLWFQLLSHKLLRLASPWALLTMLILSALLGGPVYWTLFGCQAACYLIALAGVFPGVARLRLPAAAASFVVLNAAAWLAFWVWVSGKASRSWRKVSYKLKPADAAGSFGSCDDLAPRPEDWQIAIPSPGQSSGDGPERQPGQGTLPPTSADGMIIGASPGLPG
jgi:cellulose synthase/poly-beta-1,6-N-acetylglucosamine synthase-like glycosyltransferase